MRKTASVFILILVVFVSFPICLQKVDAANSDEFSVEYINHHVTIMHNGYILINETVKLVGKCSSFQMGFPYKHGVHILESIAYDSDHSFPITLNAPLENRVGFYGVEIQFLSEQSHVFQVVFLLSNVLFNSTGTGYTLDFPAYPILTKPVAECNVEIEIPGNATYVTIEKDDGNITSLSYAKQNLPAFSYFPAHLTFSLIQPQEKLRVFVVNELKREFTINGIGEIEGSDHYFITSKEPYGIGSVQIVLPAHATNPIVQDQFARKMDLYSDINSNICTVVFTSSLGNTKSTRFTVKYSLPTDVYIKPQDNQYTLIASSLLFWNLNYYVEDANIVFMFPEGAKTLDIADTLSQATYSFTQSTFQETVFISLAQSDFLQGIANLTNNWGIVYEYNVLWASFRPTLWISTLAIIGFAVVFFRKKPEVPTHIPVKLKAPHISSDNVRLLIEWYEEKEKIMNELDFIKTKIKKRKISRRRYKVQRRTLETRYNTLSRTIEELQQKIGAAGGLYAELMRQLTVSENEIKTIKSDIRNITTRHKRGELPLDVFRKLHLDHKNKKDGIEKTIKGILLRLREEIS